jgi:hypothetical protein
MGVVIRSCHLAPPLESEPRSVTGTVLHPSALCGIEAMPGVAEAVGEGWLGLAGTDADGVAIGDVQPANTMTAPAAMHVLRAMRHTPPTSAHLLFSIDERRESGKRQATPPRPVRHAAR